MSTRLSSTCAVARGHRTQEQGTPGVHSGSGPSTNHSEEMEKQLSVGWSREALVSERPKGGGGLSWQV